MAIIAVKFPTGTVLAVGNPHSPVFMSTRAAAIHPLIQTIPVCSLPMTVATLLPLFSKAGTDIVVCVDAAQKPLGAIALTRLLPHLHALNTPISSQWLDPLITVQLTENREILFPPTLNLQTHSQKYYSVVNHLGCYQGLINGWQILPLLPPPPAQPLQTLTALLEQIPLPLMLQTQAGQILQRNRPWQLHIDEQEESWHQDHQAAPHRSPQADCPPPSGKITEICLPAATPPSGSKHHQDSPRTWKLLRFPFPLTADGELLWLVLATDITEQRQLCKELAAKNADLVQLNRLKDEFLACISHELKTPLTAVLGLSKLLKDPKLGPLNSRQSRYAQLIYQSGRQLMRVVNDILDLTRLETGQLKLNPEPVKVAALCDRAYKQALSQTGDTINPDAEVSPQTPFALVIEPGLDDLVADELRLRQMLSHLLENALKFTPPTGQIGLTVSRWQGWIDFTVWDTGIGIPESAQHLIFQKFQQLESPLTRQFEGAGLGLVLTQRLARAHGGEISFISQPGEGSRFTLLLPPSPPQPSQPQPPTPNQWVLIVEVVPRYIERLTHQLQQLGYRVLIARSGTEALEKARQIQPRFILLNPLLPLLSGWDVLTLLKADPTTQGIPVLVTATHGERQLAQQNGANGFLTLPVKLAPLRESLLRLQATLATAVRTLTLLHLNANPQEQETGYSAFVAQFGGNQLRRPVVSSADGHQISYRLLEADDLEQADILARVWKPDVLLLDGRGVPNMASFLRSLTCYESLVSRPLVTLDKGTTAIANQYPQLRVFPCLIPITPQTIAALFQVIQVAVGITVQSNILVACDGLQSHISKQPNFLHALTQYLHTAGLRPILSKSWPEAKRQLQQNTVDLFMIYVDHQSCESAWLQRLDYVHGHYEHLPMLLLDYRDLSPTSPNALRSRVTATITDRDESMTVLLQRVHQMVAGCWR